MVFRKKKSAPHKARQGVRRTNKILKRVMKEKRQVRQVTDPAWVIRWIDPYGLECKSGSYEEAKAYAEKKAKETGNTYLIF